MSRALLAIPLIVTSHLVDIAHAEEDSRETPSVTPYRPSVSTPAALSAPGWLEAEIGITHAHGGAFENQDSVPYTLKLAFSPDWGIRVGGNALLRNTDPDGVQTTGFGDTQMVLKRRFGIDETSAFGVEVGANFPTAKSGLGSMKTDYSANAIYSADLSSYHVDINLIFTRLGAMDPGTGRTQTTWATALSRQLDERWGMVGELSGTHQANVQSTSQLLVAGTYNVSRSVAWDFGVSHGFTTSSTTWSVFSGVTVLVDRLF